MSVVRIHSLPLTFQQHPAHSPGTLVNPKPCRSPWHRYISACEILGGSVSYQDSLRFYKASLPQVGDKWEGSLKSTFPFHGIKGGEQGDSNNQYQEADNPDQRTPFDPAFLSSFEVLNAIPTLILPCPPISFGSQNEQHDDTGEGNQGKQSYPGITSNRPYPAQQECPPAPPLDLSGNYSQFSLSRCIINGISLPLNRCTNGLSFYPYII